MNFHRRIHSWGTPWSTCSNSHFQHPRPISTETGTLFCAWLVLVCWAARRINGRGGQAEESTVSQDQDDCLPEPSHTSMILRLTLNADRRSVSEHGYLQRLMSASRLLNPHTWFQTLFQARSYSRNVTHRQQGGDWARQVPCAASPSPCGSSSLRHLACRWHREVTIQVHHSSDVLHPGVACGWGWTD